MSKIDSLGVEYGNGNTPIVYAMYCVNHPDTRACFVFSGNSLCTHCYELKRSRLNVPDKAHT